MLVILTSVSILFLYCFFGKIATESHSNIADCLIEANWIDLPVELQKSIMLMIASGQREFFYHGFGVIILNLETFTRVSELF